jgi:hypothetical protein
LIPQIAPVEGPQDTELPSHIAHLLQVKEDHGKVLVHDKSILDVVLQVHKVAKAGSAMPKPTWAFEAGGFCFPGSS